MEKEIIPPLPAGAPLSSVKLIVVNVEPAAVGVELSLVKVIVPLAVPELAGFVRKIVVFQTVDPPSTPFATCG